MLRSPPPRKPRDRQIQGAPEYVHGTDLTDEPGAELLEHPVGLHEDSPEPMGVLPIVCPVGFVLVEVDRLGNFVRFLVDDYRQTRVSPSPPLGGDKTSPPIEARVEEYRYARRWFG